MHRPTDNGPKGGYQLSSLKCFRYLLANLKLLILHVLNLPKQGSMLWKELYTSSFVPLFVDLIEFAPIRKSSGGEYVDFSGF